MSSDKNFLALFDDPNNPERYRWRNPRSRGQFLELRENFHVARDLKLVHQMRDSRQKARVLFMEDVAWSLWDGFATPDLRIYTPFQSLAVLDSPNRTLTDRKRGFLWSYDPPQECYEQNKVLAPEYFHFVPIEYYEQGMPTKVMRILQQARSLPVPYEGEWVGVKHVRRQEPQPLTSPGRRSAWGDAPPQHRSFMRVVWEKVKDPILAISVDRWCIPISFWE